VYSQPKILKLIETAYLAISVLDKDGNVCGFAVFEDHPQGLRGMHDDKHYNLWEPWFKQTYTIEEFSTQNTLWLTYFIVGSNIEQSNHKFVFKKIL